MASLTVREKEHWKERITRKIEQAAEKLLASENPNYRDNVRIKASKMARKSLGILELNEELEKLGEEETKIREQRGKIHQQMLATACGIVDERRYGSSTQCLPHQVSQAVQRRQSIHEKELLAGDELGRKLLELEKEKEELLDTVWLATSGKQIKQLWQKVGELLRHEPTPLQQEAMEIDPLEAE